MEYSWIFFTFGLDVENVSRIFRGILSVPRCIVMDVNDVMNRVQVASILI